MSKERLRKRTEMPFYERVFLSIIAKEIEIQGEENLPPSPFLLICNHMGLFEPLLLHFILKEQPLFVMKEEIEKIPWLGRYLGKRSLSVKRGQPDRAAIRRATDLLQGGQSLIIAIEGTRGRGEERLGLKPGKLGVIFIAGRAGVPIVPTAVWGQENVLPLIDVSGLSLRERLMYERTTVHVSFGEPFTEHCSTLSRQIGKKERLRLTNNLMMAIRDLLPERYHGVYAEGKRFS